MSGDPVLSICIPTYNRADILIENVRRVLQIDSPGIEIVINDDCSDDGTREAVAQLEDPRITYTRNDENLGYDRNLLSAIDAASGQYVFLTSDEDYIAPEAVPWLVEELTDAQDVAQLLGEIRIVSNDDVYYESEEKLLEPGYESIDHIGIWGHAYGSGIILNTDYIDTEVARDYEGILYMHIVLMTQAMTSGRTRCTERTVCYRGEEQGEYNLYMPAGPDDVKGKRHDHPLSRVYELQQRNRLASEMISDPAVQSLAYSRQRRQAASNVVSTLFSHRKHFPKVLYRTVSVDEIGFSLWFWFYVVYYILANVKNRL